MPAMRRPAGTYYLQTGTGPRQAHAARPRYSWSAGTPGTSVGSTGYPGVAAQAVAELLGDRATASAFRYDGDVLEAGYPRNDALMADGTAAARAERGCKRLGLGRASCRRSSCTPRRSATTSTASGSPSCSSSTCSVGGAGRGGYEIAVRLHLIIRGKAGRSNHNAGAGFEMEDLRGVADVLVTDYSSVMFDYVLPADGVLRVQTSRGTATACAASARLRATAPGPLARTTAQLVAVLRDHEELPLGTADFVASSGRMFSPSTTATPATAWSTQATSGASSSATTSAARSCGWNEAADGQPPWARRPQRGTSARASSRKVARKAVKGSTAERPPRPHQHRGSGRPGAPRCAPHPIPSRTGTPAHLDDREQRSRPSRYLEGNVHPDDGQRGDGGEHLRQVCGTTGPATITRSPRYRRARYSIISSGIRCAERRRPQHHAESSSTTTAASSPGQSESDHKDTDQARPPPACVLTGHHSLDVVRRAGTLTQVGEACR